MKTTIIITGQLDTCTAFGVCTTTGESVFVPAAVARPVNVIVNAEYEAIVVENAEQRREQSPWKAIKLFGEPTVQIDEDDPLTDDEALEALKELRMASAYELACQFYDKPRNSETAEAQTALDRLAASGRIAKCIISMGPLIETRYAMTLDDFKAEQGVQ
jgi:hypothetical protein